MTNPPAMVVFDMAGTTVNEDNLVYKTVLQALLNAGYETELPTVLRHGAGKEKLQAIRDILTVLDAGPVGQERAPAIHADFRSLLSRAYAQAEISPQPGAETVFRALKNQGVRVVLNTGYDRATATGLIAKLGWQNHPDIDLVITADDVSQGRPQPAMIDLARSRFSITDRSQVVKIGDSVIDIEEGRNAGCGFVVGITTGAQTAEQLAAAAPDAIVDSLTELPPIIFPKKQEDG
jgi:phosphonatase-like hydrolase